MKIFRCDTCNKETDLAENWLSIEGEIYNGLKHGRLIKSNSFLHFCSRNCFEERFFLLPNFDLFEKEIRGFQYALNLNADLTDLEKRKAFFKYFDTVYNKDAFKLIKNELNELINHYFPIED